MEDKTFCSQLGNELLENFKKYEDLYEVNFINSIINTFEIYGAFLNTIPHEVQKETLARIMHWIHNYYVRQQTLSKYNKLKYYPKIDASKRILKIKRKLADFNKIIDEEFGEFLEDLEEYGEDIHYPKSFIQKLTKISDTQKIVKELYFDIDHKKFNWFKRNRFYSYDIESKQDLSRLLNDIKYKYSLNATQLDIKELVDSIQTFKLANPF